MAPDVALGPVVQRSELAAHNGVVAGSNPAGPTTPHRCRLHRAGSNRRGPRVSDASRWHNPIRHPRYGGGDPLRHLANPWEVDPAQRNQEAGRDARRNLPRSEEHTSELQSLMRISYAVFCLKKKNNKNYQQE